MKLGIMQPYFMPYIGYFQLMKAVDKYVVYDDVNYIKGGWVSRNNILMNGEKKLFTITLQGATPNKQFKDIEIKDDFKKFSKMLQHCYAKAPYYDSIINILEIIFAYPDKHLGAFLKHHFEVILDYLHIQTELLLSSNIDKDNSLSGKEKVIHICKILNADKYYNAIGGLELYDKQEFWQSGLELSFLKTEIIPYRQFKNDFVPYLSMIDVLMFNSVEDINSMLDKYTLV